MSKPDGKKKDPLRKTLNLPKTAFGMKANLLQMEPRFQKRWERIDIFNKQLEAEHPKGDFVMHDGPPYANGNIHLGHLLNKVIKDVTVRTRIMDGYDVEYVPGWDCHGLPIEHQVMKNLGEKAKELNTNQIRHRCEKYAEKFVKLQAGQMLRLGTTGNYKNPYLTMKPAYEGATLEVFADLVEKGVVYRDLKPVHWSIANQTALADAELEYYDREDTSVFVLFAVNNAGNLPASLNVPEGETVHVMIWTTTPWTLPANLAVAAAAGEEYGLYKWTQNGKTTLGILGGALSEKVLGMGKAEDISCLGTCTGQELADGEIVYQHPFIERTGPILTADYVTLEDGTGLVHTAPGHGQEDYQTGLKVGLEIYCPVKGDGTFDETAPEWLQGKDVWSGNGEVVTHLRESGHLFFDHQFDHSYPHDWRSKTPTIFRATEQWFISVDREVKGEGKTLREMALNATDNEIEFIPDWGKSRLRGMLESRPDWCISRQRSWGLPIPAFMKEGFETLLTQKSVRAVAQTVRKEGAGFWFRASVEDILAEYDPAQDEDAPTWLREKGKAGLSELTASQDIFDVWFESGSSWNAVLKERNLGYPSEYYIEGSDQHRGWFQLSLLPSLVSQGRAPFKSLLTHGFIVDAQGRKMSKSVGNTINVQDLLDKYGADISRWWVASLNFVNDIKADWAFFKNAAEEYRKVRNTIRFLLGNLQDYNNETDRYTFTDADKGSLDAWAMVQLDHLIIEVRDAYETFQFRRIRDAVFNFCNDSLSAVYMAAIKDRLYCDATDSARRRRTQTVLFDIADNLLRLIAPVLVHTADEAWLKLHGKTEEMDESIHLQRLPESRGLAQDPNWTLTMDIRSEALKALEHARESGTITNPLDAGIAAVIDPERFNAITEYAEELADLCGVSRFSVASGDATQFEISDLAEEPRCQRSWKRDGTVSERDGGFMLSERDAAVVATMDLEN
ncbi:MAG: isoleucine--tRNA ligase [Deltaproteobacteria bacterium]|nr:isoleucine--tRNA ligase [Deltaproteobacteria bacterium]